MSISLELPITRYGILVNNLGTPDTPTPKAVNAYLKQFLSDPRVIDYPRWLWFLILNGIILPIRSRKVAKLYDSIWQDGDSPLRGITLKQAQGIKQHLLQQQQLDIPVAVGMTYGNPSLEAATQQLIAQGATRIVVLPLYPQYSATTTAATYDALNEVIKTIRYIPEIRFIHHYCHYPEYTKLLAESIKEQQQGHTPEKLVFSFHGLPQRYVDLGDPYQRHCQQTAADVVKHLQLAPEQWQVCYQSRVGREQWLTPYTDKTLEHLAKDGIKNIDVVCPAFAADCLETLEEINGENREIFLAAGGKHFRYLPALNTNPAHLEFLTQLIMQQLQGW